MKKSKKDPLTTKLPNVRPLDQREAKMDTRKGMLSIKKEGYTDLTDYKEQKLFPDEEI